MYLRPSARAARAISSMVLRPSLHFVWTCRSPLDVVQSSTSFGSAPFCAASISPRSSRSSGGISGSFSAR